MVFNSWLSTHSQFATREVTFSYWPMGLLRVSRRIIWSCEALVVDGASWRHLNEAPADLQQRYYEKDVKVRRKEKGMNLLLALIWRYSLLWASLQGVGRRRLEDRVVSGRVLWRVVGVAPVASDNCILRIRGSLSDRSSLTPSPEAVAWGGLPIGYGIALFACYMLRAYSQCPVCLSLAIVEAVERVGELPLNIVNSHCYTSSFRDDFVQMMYLGWDCDVDGCSWRLKKLLQEQKVGSRQAPPMSLAQAALGTSGKAPSD